MSYLHLLQLLYAKGIGEAAIKKINKYIACHSDCTYESICKDPSILKGIIQCKEDTCYSLANNEYYVKEIYNKLMQAGVRIITENDADYPIQIKKVLKEKCPPVLFMKGNPSLLSCKSVGFCGSRKASDKGIAITDCCVKQLVKHNITIASGYANGVDITAHLSAMRNYGSTIFVLAEGILSYSEKKASVLLNKSNHLFVSQFLPTAKWSTFNAMKRNSLILGLSKAMILIESGLNGGTFAAGKESLHIGHPLFVIDYANPVDSAAGNPYFLDNGAYPIRQRNGTPNLENLFEIIEKNDSNNSYDFDLEYEQLRVCE